MNSKSISNWREFQEFARKIMSQYFGVSLKERSPSGFPKKFDMVSDNGDIVGDAKFLTLVHRKSLPCEVYGNSRSCLVIRKSKCKETLFGIW
ncbi:MAG: hypothetical protein N2V75_07855 [Methanophagales archaeon]|nr:hypothetical protein [Methanophagales archaeon]